AGPRRRRPCRHGRSRARSRNRRDAGRSVVGRVWTSYRLLLPKERDALPHRRIDRAEMVAGHAHRRDVQIGGLCQFGGLLAAAGKQEFLAAVVDPHWTLEAARKRQGRAHAELLAVVLSERNQLLLSTRPGHLIGRSRKRRRRSKAVGSHGGQKGQGAA